MGTTGYKPEESIPKLWHEIEVRLASRSDVPSACRVAGIRDATYYILTVFDE